jgi:hypothetical protein
MTKVDAYAAENRLRIQSNHEILSILFDKVLICQQKENTDGTYKMYGMRERD